MSAFTCRGASDVVSPVNPDTSGAAWPAVSRSVVSCAGPLLQAGTGIVSSSRESLEHVRLDDQISEPLFGQAAADTESMEKSTEKIVVWVALIAMLSVPSDRGSRIDVC